VSVGRDPHSIVVTSPGPEEGKTSTAINLALVLRQSGARVCIVEGDLRRPKISRYLGLENAVGLTSVLIEEVELAAAIQSWGEGDQQIDVIPSGPLPPNPAGLLGSPQMKHVLRHLELDYDVVLVDAPPLLPVTDAAVLANAASAALVVVRHGKTRREQLRAALGALTTAGADVLGCVLTMVRRGGTSYAYSSSSTAAAMLDYGAAEPTTSAPAQQASLARAGSRNRASENGEGESNLAGDPAGYFER
jgi:non-specific protein-tyrosine kinase